MNLTLQRKILISLFIILLSLAGLNAQYQADDDAPRWLKLEKGRNALRERELGEALQIFRRILSDAQKQEEQVPEAEMWLGYIFEQEGEWELAQEQYLRALDHADSLYVPEDQYTILYRLGDIYSNSFQHGKYEQTLKRIVALGSDTLDGPDPAALAFQESMYTVLLRDGIDKLFTLYRKDERHLQRAYSELGHYYYKTGLYGEAVRNYISALVTPVTNIVAYQRLKDFVYEYSTLENFLKESSAVEYLSAYMEETLFPANLYYLGASLHAGGYAALAKEVWQALIRGIPEGEWSERAARQISRPFIEPLLTPRDWE